MAMAAVATATPQRQQQQGLLWRLAVAEEEKEKGPGGGRRALFFSNKTLPALPSAAPPLRYNPCSAAHAAAYLNREVSECQGQGQGADSTSRWMDRWMDRQTYIHTCAHGFDRVARHGTARHGS